MSSENITVTLPDGTQKSYSSGTTVLEVAESIGAGLARAALAGKVDGRSVDLSHRIEADSDLAILTFRDEAGKEVYWHSTAHVMAQAVQDLFPDVKVTIGPPIEGGFYYDFDVDNPFTPEDLDKIHARMAEIAKENQPLEREEVPRDEAYKLFEEMGDYRARMLSSDHLVLS